MKLYGVGITDLDGYSKTREYDLWKGILRRCYAEGQPSCYDAVTVHADWLLFSNFLSWLQEQPAYNAWASGQFKKRFFSVDKDLLGADTKEYGSQTCCLIPQSLNLILSDRSFARGKYPLGVTRQPKDLNCPYVAQISIDGVVTRLGYYSTPEQAHEVWRSAKVRYLQDSIEKYKVSGYCDQRVVESLMMHIEGLEVK